jgi:hypothetical protein
VCGHSLLPAYRGFTAPPRVRMSTSPIPSCRCGCLAADRRFSSIHMGATSPFPSPKAPVRVRAGASPQRARDSRSAEGTDGRLRRFPTRMRRTSCATQ